MSTRLYQRRKLTNAVGLTLSSAAMAVGLLTFAVVLLLLPIPDTRG